MSHGLNGCRQLNLSHTLLKLVAIFLAKVKIMINESSNLVGEIPSPLITEVIVRVIELNNKNLCYKLG